MRINTRLKVAALAPLLMALIVGVAIWFAHGAMRMAQERGRIAERVTRSMNDLHSLVGLYALHHEERTRQQFLAEHDTTAQLLAAAGFDDPEQQRLLEALRENTDTMKDLFLRTVAIHERPPSSPEAEALGRDENRLMGQLLVRSRQAVADGLRLDTLVDDEIVAMQSRTEVLVIFPILIVTLPLTLLLARMMSRIARGLATLRRGTQVVGTGNLAHRIGLSGEDELAGLAQAFDQMMENLQAVSVSRNELEGEVEVRRRTEAALRESEERLNRAQEIAHLGSWELDLVKNRLIWSDEVYRIFGLEPQEFGATYEAFLEAVHSDDRAAVDAAYSGSLMEGRDTYEIEHRVVRKSSDEIRLVYERCQHLRDATGRIVRSFGMVHDITNRKRADEALRESEEKYRSIVEDMPAMICRFLPDGTLTFVNREYCRYFAREDHELIGENFFQFVPKDEHEQVRNHFKSLSAAAPVVTYEHKVQAPDGAIRWQRWTDRALLDQRGRVVEYQSIGNDITERKLALAEKAELERQLQQAHKMEAIGTLAGGIAHDFNNLLQAVLGYAQVLLSAKTEDHPDCSKLRTIVSAAERGAQLVRELLTFSRSMESDRRPLNLNQEVLTLSTLFKGTFPKMIKVELDLAENLATINADPAQVEQVIMNLAVNARDAMPKGGKLIIRTENVTPDEEFSRLHPEAIPCDYVSLTVTDTGHGMDEETLARIFEPFFTTKEFGKGAGLGLAIVYGIVKSHKGLMICSSQTGKGTTFKVYFPQAEGQTQQEQSANIDAPLERGTETILIVDDEEMIRDLWLEMGGNAGYRVIAAADGESALELYRKEKDRVGLIVLDLMMPGMGGIRCLEELRRINPKARILVASGHIDGEFMKQAMSLGAKGHISKPFDLSRTLKAVRDALDEA